MKQKSEGVARFYVLEERTKSRRDEQHIQKLIADRRKQRKRGRVLKVVACLISVMLLFAIAGVSAYGFMLNSQLSSSAGERLTLDGSLVSSDENKPFYMLFLGSDSREGLAAEALHDENNSDVIVLVRVDIPNKLLTLVSIPRDTPVALSDGSKCKINQLYGSEGATGLVNAVSKITGVSISHYAEVKLSGIQDIVDSLGGVTVDVPVAIAGDNARTGERVYLQPGVQVLNGVQAQAFVQERHEYAAVEGGEDQNRQNAVRQVFQAIVKSALARPINEVPQAILTVASYVRTDLDASEIVSLASSFAMAPGDTHLYSGTGPTDGAVDESNGGAWLCYEDPDGWKALMAVVESGGDPSTVKL